MGRGVAIMKPIKLALIAHDGKKASMVSFVMKRLDFFQLNEVSIVATGTTGKMITSAGVTKVETVSSGPMGGDAEIGAMVTRKELDGVIFFRDPLDKHPHDVDISMLMRLCDVHNLPLATNYKSAHVLIKYYKNKKDKNDYVDRNQIGT
jgi:methylglyoxal synthase